MRKAALVAISTPLDEMNWFTKLMQFTTKRNVIDENGNTNEIEEFFFHTLHIGLVCENCAKSQSADKMIQCVHMAHMEPPWKGGDRRDRIKQVSMEFGDVARGLRETFGKVIGDDNRSFPQDKIRALLGPEHQERTCHNPSFIVMTIDPGAGGNSETAIASGYFLNEPQNRTCFTGVIVGLDAMRCKDHLIQEHMIIKHLNELRRRFRDARIIVVPENQTGFFHTRIDEMIPTHPNCKVFHQTDKKAGVCKTNIITSNYVHCMESVLHEDALAFDENWFTTSMAKKNSTDHIRNMRESLRDELLRFGRDDKNKLTGKFGSFSDDKAIAIMMFFYWGTKMLEASPSNNYLDYLPEHAHNQFVLPQLQKQLHTKSGNRGGF
jgi:hypothetical protein